MTSEREARELEAIVDEAIGRAFRRHHVVTLPMLVLLLNHQTGIIVSQTNQTAEEIIATLNAAVSAAADRVVATVAALDAKIDALTIDQGDADELHALTAGIADSVTAINAIDPDPVTPPTDPTDPAQPTDPAEPVDPTNPTGEPVA